MRDWRADAIALAAGLAAFLLGRQLESRLTAISRASRGEMEWISDVVLATAVAITTWLWLHLKASRSRLLELERRQVALNEQLRLAAEIQRKLLPEIPGSALGFRWAARLVPAERISGDFYDFVRRSDEVLAILGDVSGKGVPAALVQSSLQTLFRLVSRQTNEPAEIVARMSAALHEETGGLPYATCIVARFEAGPPRIASANAGHPAGLLRNDGVWMQLEAGGPPLGLLPTARYEEGRTELAAGSLGVFATDGITEALVGLPLSLSDALSSPDGRAAAHSVPLICDYLLRLAAAAPGPAGVVDWQDDRAVLAFASES